MDKERKKLELVEEMPEKGWVLAYRRGGVVFKAYDLLEGGSKNELEALLKAEDLLEIHLFDAEKEWRAISSRRHGWKSVLVSDAGQTDKLEENVYLGEEFKNVGEKLRIVNYLTYDENSMIHVNNYRMAGVGESYETIS